jgi:purine nucleosidase
MTDGLPVSPRCRVIVDNDYQGDPDGLVALAHHLLSPSNRVAVITSSFLNPRWPVASPLAEDGAALADGSGSGCGHISRTRPTGSASAASGPSATARPS